jgi:hypothetical protein
MKKFVLGIAATTCLVVTGCGAVPSGQGPSAANAVTGQQSTAGNSATSLSNNSTDANAASTPANSAPVSDTLQPYTGFQGQGLTVSVPQGWISSTASGGDYKAVTFSNPSNPKEQVRVLYSTCVGCYMTSTGKPDPTQVIGEKNASNVQVSGAGGMVADYDFSIAASPYQGTGQVQLSTNQSGYAEVDVVVSPQNQNLRDAIMKSFHYAS